VIHLRPVRDTIAALVIRLHTAVDTTAALVIHLRLVNPLVGTVVPDQHHHLVKHATKSASLLVAAAVVERVVKEERVDMVARVAREDTMAAVVSATITDVSYRADHQSLALVMLMMITTDLVFTDLMMIVSIMVVLMMIYTLEDTTEDQRSVDTTEDTEERVERVDTEERVDMEERVEKEAVVVATKFVKSFVKLCTTIKISLSCSIASVDIFGLYYSSSI